MRLDAVLIERTMTLLNCYDIDLGEKRQFRMHRIQRAEVLADSADRRPRVERDTVTSSASSS